MYGIADQRKKTKSLGKTINSQTNFFLACWSFMLISKFQSEMFSRILIQIASIVYVNTYLMSHYFYYLARGAFLSSLLETCLHCGHQSADFVLICQKQLSCWLQNLVKTTNCFHAWLLKFQTYFSNKEVLLLTLTGIPLHCLIYACPCIYGSMLSLVF